MRRAAWVAVCATAAAASAAAAQSGRAPLRLYPLVRAPAVAAASPATRLAVDSRAAALAARLRGFTAQLRASAPRATVGVAVSGDDGAVRVVLRPNGTPRQIRGLRLAGARPGGPAAARRTARDDAATARAFLRRYRGLLRLDDPDGELRLVRRHKDALGRRHLRFEQAFAGVPVWPAELIVHLDADGNVDGLDGAFVPTPRAGSLAAAIGPDEAVARARAAVRDGNAATATAPVLLIDALDDAAPRLAWRIELTVSLAARWLVLIDAQTGAALRSLDLVLEANVAGSGTDVFGVTRPLNVWEEGGTFYMVNTSKPMFDPSSDPPVAERTRGGIVVLDARNEEGDAEGQVELFQVTSRSATVWSPRDAVSAAFGLSETYDYFLQRHGRDSLDGRRGTLLGVIRFGRGFENAFWNGTLMVFGDALPYAGALDVVAHELTHGVTQYTANLLYENQPGAANEAFSDIFGEAVEARTVGTPDWLKGQRLGEPLQNYRDPNAIPFFPGRPHPARMSQFVASTDPVLNNFQDRDHGGVHINSNILNHAFYLLAEGLPGALGLVDAERVFYRALSTRLVMNSQFVDVRLACVAAAEELFGGGSAAARRTADAFDAVEIFADDPTPPPPPFPEVTGDDATLFLFVDVDSGQFFLGRREGAEDGESGVVLSGGAVGPARPAVSGDGSFAVFVDAANDLCGLPTDGSEAEICLGFPGQIHSVAMAPDGERFGFVFRSEQGPDNSISVVDVDTQQVDTFPLRAPGLDDGGFNTVLYADAMDFTADGRFLAYDAFNQIEVSGEEPVGVWSIYARDLLDGSTVVLVPPTEGVDIAFPAFSQTSDNFLTFDAFDQVFRRSAVMAGNLTTGELAEVATVDGFGVPGYTGDDTAIVHSVPSRTATGFSLVRQPLAADRITPQGAAAAWLPEGDFGVIYRRGPFVGPQKPCFGDCDEDGVVTVDEVVLGVQLALGVLARQACAAFDPDGDGLVTIDALLRAVVSAQRGCLAPP